MHVCPQCKKSDSYIKRCAVCPLRQLDEARATSEAGKLFETVLDLDYATQTFSVDWSDVSAEQAIGLAILKEERIKALNKPKTD